MESVLRADLRGGGLSLLRGGASLGGMEALPLKLRPLLRLASSRDAVSSGTLSREPVLSIRDIGSGIELRSENLGVRPDLSSEESGGWGLSTPENLRACHGVRAGTCKVECACM